MVKFFVFSRNGRKAPFSQLLGTNWKSNLNFFSVLMISLWYHFLLYSAVFCVDIYVEEEKKKKEEEEWFLEGDVSSCWAAHRGVVERHQIWEDLTVHYRLYIQHTHDGWPAGGSKIKFNSLGWNRCCLFKNICVVCTTFLLLPEKNNFSTRHSEKEIQPVPFYKSSKRFSRPSIRPSF